MKVDNQSASTQDNARWTAEILEEMEADLAGTVVFMALPVLAASGVAALQDQIATNVVPVFREPVTTST